MFENVLKRLEDPRRPLLGPNVKSLKFWGLLLPGKNVIKRCLYLFIHLTFAIFVVTEYIDIWLNIDDINLVMNNVKLTLMSSTSLCKAASSLIWQSRWKSVIDYVTRADAIQRNSDDVTKNNIITKYTKYCRKITYLYWSFSLITVIMIISTPVLKYLLSATYRENVKNGTEAYIEVLRSWVPFDKSTIPGYLAAAFYQSYITCLGGGWITAFDTNVVVIMMFFKMELELLRYDSHNIYGTEKQPVTDNEAAERLKDVHKRHEELVKFSRLFNSCLSPVMFFYFFACSIMLCFTTYQITTESNAMQQFLISEYLMFSTVQLFNFCWHSNEVLYTSYDLMLGPYESTWWKTDAKRRKDICILVAQFRKVIIFSAGPFVELTVSTFISILKGAYSYYTLLSQSQNI